MGPAPFTDACHRSPESSGSGHALDHRDAAVGVLPPKRETEQIKRPWPARPRLIIGGAPCRMSEVDEPRLLWVKCQTILGKSRWQYALDTQGIALVGEADDEVVRIPDEKRTAVKPWLHVSCEPFVEHLVEVDVRQERRDDAALRCADPGVAYCAPFPHPR